MIYSEAEYVPIFKALADETRLKIIRRLSRQQLCACHLLEGLEITQPTLSYHMKILTDSGIVIGKKEGAWMHYALNEEKLIAIKEYLNL